MRESTAVKAQLIKAKGRPDLVVEYDGNEYTLPGRIPAEIMTIQAEHKKPKNPAKDVQEQFERELGVAIMNEFYSRVIPDDFKAAVDLEDLEQVFTVWSEHVGLGGTKGSAN